MRPMAGECAFFRRRRPGLLLALLRPLHIRRTRARHSEARQDDRPAPSLKGKPLRFHHGPDLVICGCSPGCLLICISANASFRLHVQSHLQRTSASAPARVSWPLGLRRSAASAAIACGCHRAGSVTACRRKICRWRPHNHRSLRPAIAHALRLGGGDVPARAHGRSRLLRGNVVPKLCQALIYASIAYTGLAGNWCSCACDPSHGLSCWFCLTLIRASAAVRGSPASPERTISPAQGEGSPLARRLEAHPQIFQPRSASLLLMSSRNYRSDAETGGPGSTEL